MKKLEVTTGDLARHTDEVKVRDDTRAREWEETLAVLNVRLAAMVSETLGASTTSPHGSVAGGRRSGGATAAARRAADSLRAHDDVVPVPLLADRRGGVPELLEEHRVDAIVAVGPEPRAAGRRQPSRSSNRMRQ